MRIIFLLCLFFHFSFAQLYSLKDAFMVNFYPNEQGIVLHFKLGDAIFLYRERLKLKLDGKDLSSLLSYPKSQFLGNEEGYFKSLDLIIPASLLDKYSKQESLLELSYQGCSISGFCYAPQFLKFSLQKDGKLYTLKTPTQKNSKNEENRIKSLLENENFIIIVSSFFLYGLLLSLTPCTLPMIPILSSIIIAKNSVKNKSKKNAFFLSFIYVLFMSLAYALAGVGASFLGLSVQGFLQKPIVLSFFAFIFVLFAFFCFKDFNFILPTKFQAFIHNSSQKGRGVLSVALMGFLSALIVGPCIAPPLAGALLYIASSKDALLGGLSLFVMGFGMGVPLLFLGLGLGFLKPGVWMQKIKFFFGFVLLALALWMLSRFVRGDYILIAYGILGVFFVVFMGLFDGICGWLSKVKKALLILCLSYALMLFVGGISGSKSFSNPLNFTTKEKQGLIFESLQNLTQIQEKIKNEDKILLYFSASWCEYCKVLENEVFVDEKVIKGLENYEKIKIDVSENNALQTQIMQEFGVFAPPVLIFFEKGMQREKITGYITSDELLKKDL